MRLSVACLRIFKRGNCKVCEYEVLTTKQKTSYKLKCVLKIIENPKRKYIKICYAFLNVP